MHLHLDHLAVGYNGKALISGIEIGVRRGEIVTLVGPNGSGKSTILKSITRQLSLIDGQILLAAEPAPAPLKNLADFTPGELARQMAVVLTGRLQTELMTCRDVTAMGRYPYTGRLGILSDEDEQKVENALVMVHAQHLSERPFDAVSDGERQRILLARAICQEPEIIVLDEPTSYLDIRHKLELLSILHKMAREKGITVVMSLHEIDLAMKISDRVICVRGEKIFACGKPSEILDDETVRQLYDLNPELGRFDARKGSLELRFTQAPPSAEKETAPVDTDISSKHSLAIPRVMIAAPGSGSGKTLITCGLLRLLQRKDLHPAAFKCGPDYIDPMFHRQVLGVHSRNLDTFFSPSDSGIPGNTVKETLARAVKKNNAEIAVIEGVMGYFDGTGASGMQASSCDLAQQTISPVILVVNAKGMSRSVSALLRGFTEFERDKESRKGKQEENGEGKQEDSREGKQEENREGKQGKKQRENPEIRGVILNRISAGMFPMMKKWIEEDTGLKVIGFVPQDDTISWGSRHLGLLQPEEVKDLQQQIDHLADILERSVDLEALLELARSAPVLSLPESASITPSLSLPESASAVSPPSVMETARGVSSLSFQSWEPECSKNKGSRNKGSKNKNAESTGTAMQTSEKPVPRIAVARDEAFSFYYEDNLELLRECGAETVFFSPLHDKELPGADGLLLGGGYPELHAQELAENEDIKAQICRCADSGMPILAECGGFMYLQQLLEIPEKTESDDSENGKPNVITPGRCFKMCGVLPGTCRMTDRLVRFGYIELEKKDGESGAAGYLQDGHRIRGHEFHYFDSTDNGDVCTAQKPGRKRSWDCMVVRDNIMAGFPHLYYRSDPEFARNFVEKCSLYREQVSTESKSLQRASLYREQVSTENKSLQRTSLYREQVSVKNRRGTENDHLAAGGDKQNMGACHRSGDGSADRRPALALASGTGDRHADQRIGNSPAQIVPDPCEGGSA